MYRSVVTTYYTKKGVTYKYLFEIVLVFSSGIPLVSVMYSAIWTFTDVLPRKCKDISSRLDNLKDIFTNYCHLLDIDSIVQLTYSFLVFQVYSRTEY